MTDAAREFRQHVECARCGCDFVVRAPLQRFCSDACRSAARSDGTLCSPEYRAKMRLACRAWADENRGVKRRQPWLSGAPPFESHLPGGFLEMSIDHPLRWPIEHRNVRALHGALTALTGDHHPIVPRFALSLGIAALGGASTPESALFSTIWPERDAWCASSTKSACCVLAGA